MLRRKMIETLKRTGAAAGLAVAMALAGMQAVGAAAPAERLWSVVAHFEYIDGFEYDYVVRTGMSTAEMADALARCGQGHWIGAVLRFYCYPIPE